jgi:hypothetical protein
VESPANVEQISNLEIFSRLTAEANALFLFDRLPPGIQFDFLRAILITRIPSQDD